MAAAPIRVTVWGEYVHERESEQVRPVYPHGHALRYRRGLRAQLGDAVQVRTATLDQPEHGLTDEVLARPTCSPGGAHGPRRVEDAVVERVREPGAGGHGPPRPALRPRVEDLQAAHGHHLLAALARVGRSRAIWCVNPGHPIAARSARGVHRPAGRDLCRVLRHPAARRVGLPQHLLAAARCSAAGAASRAAPAGSSTSSPATRRTRSTSRARSSRCSPTPCAGPPADRAGSRDRAPARTAQLAGSRRNRISSDPRHPASDVVRLPPGRHGIPSTARRSLGTGDNSAAVRALCQTVPLRLEARALSRTRS